MLIGEEDGRAIWETQFLTWVPGLSQSIHRARAEDIAAGPLTSAGERRDAEPIAPSADGRQEVASSGLKPRAQRLLGTDCTGSSRHPTSIRQAGRRPVRLLLPTHQHPAHRLVYQVLPTQRWSTSSAVPAL